MIRHLWPLLVGFSVWAVAFVGIYWLQYLGCLHGWEPSDHRTSLIVFYGAAVIALVLLLMFQIARERRLKAKVFDRLGSAATVSALAATVVTLAPTLVASACI